MAREHARILCTIWSPGDDFRQRTPDAQRLYFLVLSQRELNNAGVIPLMVSKWARCSASTTVEDIEKALSELEDNRYVVVDRETDEVLVRTFVRNDGIAKQPNMLKSALRAAGQIESESIRHALARELLRLGHPDATKKAFELDPGTRREGFAEGIARPSSTSVEQPLADPSSTSVEEGCGVGEGKGEGVSPVDEGSSRETPARPSERCTKHADVDEPGPCGRCGAARRAAERWDAEQADAADVERARRRELIEACPDCDDNGMRDLGVGLARCTHPELVGASS